MTDKREQCLTSVKCVSNLNPKKKGTCNIVAPVGGEFREIPCRKDADCRIFADTYLQVGNIYGTVLSFDDNNPNKDSSSRDSHQNDCCLRNIQIKDRKLVHNNPKFPNYCLQDPDTFLETHPEIQKTDPNMVQKIKNTRSDIVAGNPVTTQGVPCSSNLMWTDDKQECVCIIENPYTLNNFIIPARDGNYTANITLDSPGFEKVDKSWCEKADEFKK